jgi:hypothetical protein
MSIDSPSEPPSDHDPANLPADIGTRAGNVRTAAAEVWRRVGEWRDSPTWRDDETNRRRYNVTAHAIAALDALPDPEDHDGAAALAKAVQPIAETWRPNRAGPEQTIYAAVDRLREAVRRLIALGPTNA